MLKMIQIEKLLAEKVANLVQGYFKPNEIFTNERFTSLLRPCSRSHVNVQQNEKGNKQESPDTQSSEQFENESELTSVNEGAVSIKSIILMDTENYAVGKSIIITITPDSSRSSVDESEMGEHYKIQNRSEPIESSMETIISIISFDSDYLLMDHEQLAIEIDSDTSAPAFQTPIIDNDNIVD